MNDYTTKKRYCPHLLETKLHAVEIYRQTKDISFVCRRYHISKASLMRWNRAYDGISRESILYPDLTSLFLTLLIQTVFIKVHNLT